MEKDNIKNNAFTQESKSRQNIIRILKGTLFSIIISLVLLLIFALVLTYTNIPETTIMPVTLIITGISILIGSMISTRKIRKNGLLNGGTVGLLYIIFLYIVSSLCFVGFSITLNSFIMLAIGAITGIAGGIVGVNKK